MNSFNRYSVDTSIGHPNTSIARSKSLPPILWIILGFTSLAFYGSGQVLGFNLSGLGWVIPLAFALLILARNFSAVTFPWFLWLPWILLLFIYLTLSPFETVDPRVIPVQRTAQMLAPLLVGMAVSTIRPSEGLLRRFVTVSRALAVILLGGVAWKLRFVWIEGWGDYSGMAAEMMTVVLLCALFANRYALHGEKKDLLFWFVLVCVPVINVTRTAIASTFLTLPFAFGPLSLKKRAAFLLLMAAIGMGVFYLPRVQQKMFFSGRGEISDIFSDDFVTSGRSYMWDRMWVAAHEEPWVGHGTGAGETFTYDITGGIAYPHNDWLLTYYDYGLLGVVVLAFCLIATVLSVLRAARTCRSSEACLLLLAGGTVFIPFMLLMATDNVLVYSSFFGNLHFTFLGLGFSAWREEMAQLSRLDQINKQLRHQPL